MKIRKEDFLNEDLAEWMETGQVTIEPGKEEIKVVRVVGIGLNVGLKKKGD